MEASKTPVSAQRRVTRHRRGSRPTSPTTSATTPGIGPGAYRRQSAPGAELATTSATTPGLIDLGHLVGHHGPPGRVQGLHAGLIGLGHRDRLQ
ncbi:MAG: hypothetical protein OXG34_04425, partial [bacterium]|nr:hypothetical protein [bacterium]